SLSAYCSGHAHQGRRSRRIRRNRDSERTRRPRVITTRRHCRQGAGASDLKNRPTNAVRTPGIQVSVHGDFLVPSIGISYCPLTAPYGPLRPELASARQWASLGQSCRSVGSRRRLGLFSSSYASSTRAFSCLSDSSNSASLLDSVHPYVGWPEARL